MKISSSKIWLVSWLLASTYFSVANTALASTNHTVENFNSMPINIVENGVKPRVLINSSNDHQLYFKAYNDYSDIDGDGIADKNYKHSINYYGYFDSYKCYTYNTANTRFEPKSFTTDKYCYNGITNIDNDSTKGEWSGNFLNWVSMSRIDSIRKILFGGHRRVDQNNSTTLERAYIPHDAHSWAKYYSGGDIKKLTPFNPGVVPVAGGLNYACDEGNAIDPNTKTVNPLCKDPDDDPDYFDCNNFATLTAAQITVCTANNQNDPYFFKCADHTAAGSPGYNACKNVDVKDPRYRRNRWAYSAAEDYQDKDWDGTKVDMKKVGITLGNTTDVNTDNYGNNVGSEVYTEPPLIKVVHGNYTLWGSGEAYQITWSSDSPVQNYAASNANNSEKSSIPAYPNSPSWNERLGSGNYVARVQACVNGLIDSADVAAVAGSTKEKCKRYPGTNGVSGDADDSYKPIGLLQTYGDEDKMHFGMIAGTYRKHASGGDIIRNVGSFTDEVKVATDGTFPLVAKFAGGPLAENANGAGLVNAWSLYRIINYDNQGQYNGLDNCPWGLTAFADVTAPNACMNWGNPFSEIYYQSINYFAKGGVIGPYHENTSVGIPGLPTPQGFTDPLDESSSCAQLSVVNLNSSVISYDADELDDNSYAPDKVWDPAVLPGNKSSTAMTKFVGDYEQLSNKKYFVGEVNMGSGEDQLCTQKTLTNLGTTGGLCPEAPRLSGSYRIAGLAYYAHVEDIRPDNFVSRKLSGDQVMDTYSVALATGAPLIEIPDPVANATSQPLATILPACRNLGSHVLSKQGNLVGYSLNPPGNCAVVDFKVISQNVDTVNHKVTGKVYIDWEDSEQGGDYDQDMWGTLKYTLDKTANTLTVTTQVFAQSASMALGFGYTLGGTSNDGFHAHSGIWKYKNTETADAGSPNCSDADGCNCRADWKGECNSTDSGPSTKTYTLGESPAKLLKDPLWYAAKYGGFIDQNDNKLPDKVEEWDSKINATGGTGSDGIPDNYFYATNPRQLEQSLDRVFNSILERTSSGTAAAVVSSNVNGEGALYQAYYEPLKKDVTGEARWLGTVQALWLDSYGLTRQDCSPPDDGPVNKDGFDDVTGKCLPNPNNFLGGVCKSNGRLDNYCVDQVVETYYDDLEKRTRMRIYESDSPDTYSPYSMQGVVSSYSAGDVVMIPNSMEGMATYTSSPETLAISPYNFSGNVTEYDPVSGSGKVVVGPGGWTGPAALGSYSRWGVSNSSGAGVGYSTDTITTPVLAGAIVSFTVNPTGSWLVVGDTLTFKTKNLIGASGKTFRNWTVECLDKPATGAVNNVGLQLNDSSDDTFSMTTVTPDFSGCTMAKISSYNAKGTIPNKYSQWLVANLSTNATAGESTDELELGNKGTRSFHVTPTVNWLNEGDSILVSNYNFDTKELYKIGYLWNAREELYLDSVSDAVLANNRSWNDPADKGRYIVTWVDTNLNKIKDTGEARAFSKDMFTDVSYTFFDVNDGTEAGKVVDYIRGIEVPGFRNRSIKYSIDDTAKHVMRLGDIVNSTPAVVASPQEGFDLLYKDASYRAFRQQYINRRIMIYTGGNDGLVHAINGGFYNKVVIDKGLSTEKSYVEYSTKGKTYPTAALPNGADAVEHPLGSEVWAYAPNSLLSHLQWLKDPNYGKSTHVYYMDAKPRIFDAKIFTPNDDHKNGWGTVMVIGMNLGGKSMNLPPLDVDNNAATPPVANVQTKSAYVIFDITNPEVEPKMLAEIPVPDGSLTTVYPAVVTFQDIAENKNCQSGGTAVGCNNWYLMFGNGPENFDYTTSRNAKIYLFDLAQLRTETPAPISLQASDFPTNCTVESLNSIFNVLACDTQKTKSFVGTPGVVDWELDYRSNTAYLGLIGKESSGSPPVVKDDGLVMRFGFNNKAEFSEWSDLAVMYDTDQPVVSQPMPSIDNKDKHWIFFGTGRYFAPSDKATAYSHYLYGIKDPELATSYPVLSTQILDVSNAEVYSNGTLDQGPTKIGGGATVATFSDLEKEIDANALGWRMYLPRLVGTTTDPTTRSITRSSLLGGDLFNSVFQPACDPCEGEGQSRLYGLFYKTGTAHPTETIFGTSAEQDGSGVRYRSNKYIELGQGVATSPAIHSGKGSSNDELKVFTQLSTGEIVESKAKTVQKIRTGRTSWLEN